MKTWLTAREIAEEGLPDMASTVKGVLNTAEREGWNEHPSFCRRRAGRGGGMEYDIRLLPTLARIAYECRYRPIAAPQPANDEPAQPQRPAQALSARASLEHDARAAVLRAYEDWSRGMTLRQLSSLSLFCTKYNNRSFAQVDAWIYNHVPHVSPRTLKRWRAAMKTGATIGADRGASRKGTGTLDKAEGGRVAEFILGLLAHQPHLSAGQVHTQIRKQFGDMLEVSARVGGKSVPVPPVRSIQRHIAAVKEEKAVLLKRMTDPDSFRSTAKLRGTGTLRHVTESGQLWQIDASPVDALCTDGRHSVYSCIDIATRRTLWHVSKTPRAAAVALLIRKAVLAWGAPEVVKIDNGSDFVARDTQRVLVNLGIRPEFSDPFSPEQKAHVERVIGTFQRDCSTLIPGFIGHSVSDRKAIEARKSFAQRLGEDDARTFAVQFTGAQLQTVIDEWASLHYQHKPHAGLKGRTPFEAAAASAHTVREVDERTLDLLLAPVAAGGGWRTFTAQGFRVDGAHYLDGSIMVGTRAFLRHDPNDMGRVYAFESEDGGYLGQALCAELAGVSPEAFVRAQKEEQARILTEMGKAAEAVRRELRSGPSLIERAREVWLRDVPNVTALPRPAVEHRTPAIEALERIDAPKVPVEPKPMEGRAAEIRDEIMRESAGLVPEVPRNNVTRIETRETRWRRARTIEAAIAAGDAVDQDDVLWLGGYRTDSEYRVMKQFDADFGTGNGG